MFSDVNKIYFEGFACQMEIVPQKWNSFTK